MTTTLITGATGFTGRYLATALEQAGHAVVGLSHGPAESTVPGLARTFACDLADLPRVRDIIEEVKPDHVVHLAAIAFVAHGDVEEMYRTNIVGTRHLLTALQGCAGRLRSVLVASSANIYGNGRGGTLDEDTPPAPANDYGVTKVAAEYVCGVAGAQLPVIVARPFNYTGIGQSTSFLIPKIVDHVRCRAPVIELGNLDVARDFSDVRTVVDAYARLLGTPAAIGRTVNVCSGRATSLAGVLDSVRRLSGHDFQVSVNPAFVRADEVKTLCGSPVLIESLIGPLTHIPLDDTLAWMLGA